MINKLSLFLFVVILSQAVPVGWPVLIFLILLSYFFCKNIITNK